LRIIRRLATIGWLGWAVAGLASGATPDGPISPVSTPRDDAPIPIFLNAPADRETFWKMLGRPDFVILNGDRYRKLLQGAGPARAASPAPAAQVESVVATGDVAGDRARLAVSFGVAMAVDGPAWVPIQLDGLTLTEVREGSRDLPTRLAEGRSWEVELTGRGGHPVVVSVLAPVRSTAEGRRLDLPIPPAASTRIELLVPGKVVDAGTGINEPVSVLPVEADAGARLAARLSPRSRVELTWRERSDPAGTLAALLSAQGEIALEVERGSIKARSSWAVSAIRGSVGQLAIRLDAGEEAVEVEVDKRPAPFESRQEAGRSVVVVPLAEPLRTGSTRELVLNTRRPIASTGSARVAIQGSLFEQARFQAGFLAIARSGPIFLNPTPGRGLRRIDPRTELPDGFLARHDTALAFEFNDQPFELGLVVEPEPPRLLVENRTTIAVDPRSARLDTRLVCRASQGRPFELAVLLPEGLTYEGAGPPEVVASAQVAPLNPTAGVDDPTAPRALTITLTLPAREADSFTVHLKGRCAIDASRPVAIPLFQPLADPSTGGWFAVVTDRNVSAEPIEGGEAPSPFRVEWDSPPPDWVWPARRPGPEFGLLWLRSDARPEALPLRVTVRPRSIRHESTLLATLDRTGAEVVDEVSGEVAFGAISRLDVAIPPDVPSRWDVEGVDLEGRDPIGQDPDGSRRYRLRFARDYPESFRLRIRYRLSFPEPLGPSREARLRLAPTRVLEGSSIGQHVRVAAEPGIALGTEAPGWVASAVPDPVAGPDLGPAVRVSLSRPDDRPGPVSVGVRLGPRLALPGLVVSRLWIRTVQRPEDDLATTAYFWVESRQGPMDLALPPGSRWIRARIGGREAGEGEVELIAADHYRVRFPTSTPSGPVQVSVDYEVPARSVGSGWQPPRLLEGGVVQQSAWEVRLIGGRAGIGTPPGWTDENEWYWDGLIWRRRPWRSPTELAHWLNGGNLRFRVAEPPDAGEQPGRHSYLFSRSGPPSPLRFAVFSRFNLVLLSSGPVLAVGLLVLARRPPPRAVGVALLVLGFGLAAFSEPSATIPLLQSAAPGGLLLLGALLMNWVLDRRGPGRSANRAAPIGASASLTSAVLAAPGVGSDDSTAIRPRPPAPTVSTADHIVLARSPARATESSSTDRDHR
jgi:hypothetical protein